MLTRLLLQQDGHDDNKRERWIVVDGDVDDVVWGATLAALVDGKRVFVPSGATIALKTTDRVVLECESLRHASPFIQARLRLVRLSGREFTYDITSTHCCCSCS